MALIDATLMGENSNSYVTLAYADTYFERHFNSLKVANWDGLDDDQKEQLLVQACWDLEQFRFTANIEHSRENSSLKWDSRQGRFTAYVVPSNSPVPYSQYQQLQFPRNKDIKADGTIFIPDRLKMAQCEQAIYLFSFDETAVANRLQGINLDRVSLGGIAVTQEYQYQGSALAPLAYEWIKTYFFKSTRIGRA